MLVEPESRTSGNSESNLVYRCIGVNVYRKSTDRLPAECQMTDFSARRIVSADYHPQYLAKNPDGYCGIGGCGVPFKLAELPVGEKA